MNSLCVCTSAVICMYAQCIHMYVSVCAVQICLHTHSIQPKAMLFIKDDLGRSMPLRTRLPISCFQEPLCRASTPL
eukprot:c29105_g1_i1 orf=119-346(+)